MKIFNYIRNKRLRDCTIFQLRPAERSDSDVIVQNIQSVCDEQCYLYTDRFILTSIWKRLLSDSVNEKEEYLLIVAEVKGKVVAHLRISPDCPVPRIGRIGEIGIAIIEFWREKGIGSEMLTYALEWADYIQLKKLSASVSGTNQRALNLFAKFNFVQEECRIQQLYIGGKYVDEIVLGCVLN